MFSAVAAIVSFFVSLPRTLSQLSGLGVFSAVTMGISVLLVIIFSGVQSRPFGFTGEAPIVTKGPVPGTTYVTGTPATIFSSGVFAKSHPLLCFLGMSAFLNISYTLIGQIVLPSVSFLLNSFLAMVLATR